MVLHDLDCTNPAQGDSPQAKAATKEIQEAHRHWENGLLTFGEYADMIVEIVYQDR